MARDENCIFCKIINGDIPSAKVYEDDDVLAFLDISQVTKGHTLVIPKNHVKDIYETDEATASTLFARIPKIAKALEKSFEPAGINVLNNTKEAAGQSVFHLHIHLIPRYDEDDGYDAKWITHSEEYDQEQLTEMAETIQQNVT
ncbi:histidine triad (HIT) family protein [Pelagirhabdus alkalitolerans]|uniref:Histidine triad (HIT) family protein n=1 Tax=Pelagirhabdus alkalitolerans TaxID=1612202 RepID=A0A1G6LLU6_9BACI|nr:HIT family protein [Pelagirhabdus alkalitolerans]SDC44181.1 histidine triad (HIT) family protein [Pelagirhabdus alkalitolerans]